MNMNRREAVARLALLMGGAVVGSEAFLRGEVVSGKPASSAFSEDDRELLDEIGETIIPTTNTPGGKAAGVGAFMITLVTDCYSERDHAIFQEGLRKIDAASREKFGKSFLAAAPEQRTALLNSLDAEQRAVPLGTTAGAPVPYFRMIKQASILAYFTSEIGATQALRYIETPGGFRGGDPCKKGDRAWYQPLNASTMNSRAAEGGKKVL